MRLEVNQRVRLDVTLQPGTVTADVVVRQSTPLLDTVSASVGEVIDEQQIAQAAAQRPAVPRAGAAGARRAHVPRRQHGSTLPLYWRPGQNSAISITGGRPSANAFRIDGTTNTDPSFNTYIVNLPPDAIREFQIETGELLGGARRGGYRSGQRRHQVGDAVAARQRVRVPPQQRVRRAAVHQPDELPHFDQNQYGGTLGGPLVFERTFFFGSFEGLRSTQGQSMVMSVPPEMWRMGDFSDGPPIYDPPTTRPTRTSTQPGRRARRTPADPIAVPRQRDPDGPHRPGRAGACCSNTSRCPTREGDMGMSMGGTFNNYLDTRAQELHNDQGTMRLDHGVAERRARVRPLHA